MHELGQLGVRAAAVVNLTTQAPRVTTSCTDAVTSAAFGDRRTLVTCSSARSSSASSSAAQTLNACTREALSSSAVRCQRHFEISHHLLLLLDSSSLSYSATTSSSSSRSPRGSAGSSLLSWSSLSVSSSSHLWWDTRSLLV